MRTQSIAVGLHRSTTETHEVLLYNRLYNGRAFNLLNSMLVLLLVDIVPSGLWGGVQSHFDCVLIVFAIPRV